MPKFMVDAHSLLQVRDRLGRLHDQLLGMHTVAAGYDGILGGRELEGELQHFCGRWHWGILQIGGEITDMMGRLTSAAAAYERIEHRVSQAGNGSHRQPPRSRHSGSGTTVIGRGSHHGRSHRSASGSGTTVIGGGSGSTGAGGSGGGGDKRGHRGEGSGTTVIGGEAHDAAQSVFFPGVGNLALTGD